MVIMKDFTLEKKLFQSPIVIIIASLDQDTIVLFSV